MKYTLLMYAEPSAWPPEDHQAAIQESIEICHQLHIQDQYLGASLLQPPSTAKCVRVRDGQQLVLDGLYAETKEQLGDYFLIKATDMGGSHRDRRPRSRCTSRHGGDSPVDENRGFALQRLTKLICVALACGYSWQVHSAFLLARGTRHTC